MPDAPFSKPVKEWTPAQRAQYNGLVAEARTNAMNEPFKDERGRERNRHEIPCENSQGSIRSECPCATCHGARAAYQAQSKLTGYTLPEKG